MGGAAPGGLTVAGARKRGRGSLPTDAVGATPAKGCRTSPPPCGLTPHPSSYVRVQEGVNGLRSRGKRMHAAKGAKKRQRQPSRSTVRDRPEDFARPIVPRPRPPGAHQAELDTGRSTRPGIYQPVFMEIKNRKWFSIEKTQENKSCTPPGLPPRGRAPSTTLSDMATYIYIYIYIYVCIHMHLSLSLYIYIYI